jgi:WD40 repeat protein
VWDTARLRALRTLSVEQGGTQVVVTNDGRTLAAGDGSGATRIWDVRSGQQLGAAYRVPQRIPDQPTVVSGLTFNPSETTLVMGTSEGSVVRLSGLPLRDTGAATTYLCSVVRRSFTRSEWEQLVPDQPYRPTCASAGYP